MLNRAAIHWMIATVFGKRFLAGTIFLKLATMRFHSRAYAGRFNFKGNDQQKRVGELSGGERGRLHLANTLKQGANVLLLDEPSNDLDIETLRALEEAVLSFPGVRTSDIPRPMVPGSYCHPYSGLRRQR